jgi:hypothetical protein
MPIALVFHALSGIVTGCAQIPSVERAVRSIKDQPLGDASLIVKLHVLPAFRTPVYVEETYGPKDSRILAFRVDHTGDQPKVELSMDLPLSMQSTFDTAKMDNLPGFLALSEEEAINPHYESTDGETYILEMKDKTGYHRVIRHNPSAFSKERDLLYFDSLCKEILDRAGILPRPNSLTE